MKTTKRENWKIPDCYPWQPVAKKPKPILNWNSFGYWNNFQIVIIQVVLSNEVIRQLFQFARKGSLAYIQLKLFVRISSFVNIFLQKVPFDKNWNKIIVFFFLSSFPSQIFKGNQWKEWNCSTLLTKTTWEGSPH